MRKMLLSIILFTFLLGACSSSDVVSQEQYESLEEGMTKADVEEVLGEPLEIEDDKWIYDLDLDGNIVSLTVFFLEDELFGSVTGSKDEDSQ